MVISPQHRRFELDLGGANLIRFYGGAVGGRKSFPSSAFQTVRLLSETTRDSIRPTACTGYSDCDAGGSGRQLNTRWRRTDSLRAGRFFRFARPRIGCERRPTTYRRATGSQRGPRGFRWAGVYRIGRAVSAARVAHLLSPAEQRTRCQRCRAGSFRAAVFASHEVRRPIEIQHVGARHCGPNLFDDSPRPRAADNAGKTRRATKRSKPNRPA